MITDYDRSCFTVGNHEFKLVEPGEYICGKIVVFCDQQCSTAWSAKSGEVFTSYYSRPEFAVEVILKAGIVP